jgi:hypothetical protein
VVLGAQSTRPTDRCRFVVVVVVMGEIRVGRDDALGVRGRAGSESCLRVLRCVWLVEGAWGIWDGPCGTEGDGEGGTGSLFARACKLSRVRSGAI